jgi:micrococcal nuclease
MYILKKYKIKIITITIIIVITSSFAYFSNPNNSLFKKPKIHIISNKLYEIIDVIDGDTIDIEINGKKIRTRMLGIDTPETVDPRKPIQCFGKEASDNTKSMLIGHFVTIETDFMQSSVDKYNRLLAYIYHENGLFINRYLLENGFAYEYTYGIPYSKQKEFKKLESLAKKNKLGLWGECDGK